MIKLNFFVKSNNWSRRLSRIKIITSKVIKNKENLNFDTKIDYYLNIILVNDQEINKLNFIYKNINKVTDVLTFVSEHKQNNVKNKYCDIFFSGKTIKIDSKKNNNNFYDHFTHLLVHSFLHINGYVHNSLKDYVKMQKNEIAILNSMGLENPYSI